MRDGTTEYSVMINLDSNLVAKIAVGSSEILRSKDLDLPMSFIYGDKDWV